MGRLFRRIAAAVLPAALIVVVAGPAGAASPGRRPGAAGAECDRSRQGRASVRPGRGVPLHGHGGRTRRRDQRLRRAGRAEDQASPPASTPTRRAVPRACSVRATRGSPTSTSTTGTACRSRPSSSRRVKQYWIAVLGYDGELALRNYRGVKGGTSDSVTAKGKLKSLRNTWQTASVFKNLGPASLYAVESYRVLVFTKNSTGNAAEGVAALRSLADADEVTLRRHRRRVQVHRGEPGEVPRGRVPQHLRRRAQRRPAGGVRGVLPRRRRLLRHRLGDRDRARLAVPHRRARHPRRPGKTAVQAGTIKVADRVHDASKNLPEYWTRTDAWYNFTLERPRRSATCSPPSSSASTTAARSRSSRGAAASSGITDGTMGADHPVTWCKDFRGGRSFYTVARQHRRQLRRGRTSATSSPAPFDWAAGQSDPVYSDCGATVLANYQQTKVSGPPNLSEPIGFDVLPDARVIQTDRRGGIRLHDPVTNSDDAAGQHPGLHRQRGRHVRPGDRQRLRRRTSGCTCSTRRPRSRTSSCRTAPSSRRRRR